MAMAGCFIARPWCASVNLAADALVYHIGYMSTHRPVSYSPETSTACPTVEPLHVTRRIFVVPCGRSSAVLLPEAVVAQNCF